jgi:hypothetical protein
MKKLRFLLLFLAAILLASSCDKVEKDDQEQVIEYYKDKIGVGYVFYKHANDSVAPIKNVKMEIEASGGGTGWLFPGYHHADYLITDADGKYTFKFIKTIDKEEITAYDFSFVGYLDTILNPAYNSGRFQISSEYVKNGGEQISVPTMILYPEW